MKLQAALTAVMLALGASSAMAVPVTLHGTHIDIVYDTTDLGLYGTPSLVGDLLSWTPSGFTAKRNGGPTSLTSTTSVMIYAHTGFDIASLSFSEGGSYIKNSSTGGVAAAGTVNVAVQSPPSPTMSFGFGTGSLSQGSGSWSAGTGPISFGAGAKVVSFYVSNTLMAVGGGVAGLGNQISKNTPTISFVVASVPEPETYAMLLAGLGAVAFLARRRKAA
jgi:hypothetical protein